MEIQPLLLTKAGFNREIERRAKTNPVTNEFLKVAQCDLGLRDKKLLNEAYSKVRNIDFMLQNNRIDKINDANRMREIRRSMTISRMARNGIADIDILDEDFSMLQEVEQEYTLQYYRTQLIFESINEHDFIQNAIAELAKDGKPYKSNNYDEIRKIEKELEELDMKQSIETSKPKKLRGILKMNNLETKLQELREEDFLNSEFPIEDICYKLVTDNKRTTMSGEITVWFNSVSFKNSIWFLSKTAQNKLIDLIVKSYKSMYEEEIVEYRNNKYKESKKESMKKHNKKALSPEDKHELVQIGKAEGLTQTEVAKQIGCTTRTVQRYWNTAS